MALKNLASSLGVSSKKVMAPTRMALTGVKVDLLFHTLFDIEGDHSICLLMKGCMSNEE